jgi:hypothetical protein
MAKRNHSPNFKSVKCNVCSAEAVSRPGATHRRCTGQKSETEDGNITIRPKHQAIPKANRGQWQ